MITEDKDLNHSIEVKIETIKKLIEIEDKCIEVLYETHTQLHKEKVELENLTRKLKVS